MTTQTITKVKSGSIFEERDSYSRVVRVGDTVFVANTAGRNYQTREIAPDVIGQVHQAIANVKGALESVGATLADVVRSRISVPHIEDIDEAMTLVGDYFRGIDPAVTATCTPLGGPDYRFEIEVTAIIGVGAAEQERIVIAL